MQKGWLKTDFIYKRGGNTNMDKQTVKFAVKKTGNIVTRIGRSCISHPEIHFSGGSVKWYEDKPKQQNINKIG